MNKTDTQLHIASQYLAAAAKNYTDPKDDDSHTNLGWQADRRVFQSREFSNGDMLELDTCEMKLNWLGVQPKSFELKGSSHKDVVQWLAKMATNNGLETFKFDLHYEIESGEIKDDFVFSEGDIDYLMKLAEFRSLAYTSCEQVVKKMTIEGEVRTWPHHFDTGTYLQMPDSDIGIGFGLAIPDDKSDDYYLYISGYQGNNQMSTKNMSNLSKGKWLDGDWKGALLSVVNLKPNDWVVFFEEAIQAINQQS